MLKDSPTIHRIEEAESRLNQRYDSQLCDDVYIVLLYLRKLGWSDCEIASLYDVSDILDREIGGDLLSHVHDYYFAGGGSVIGLKPPHERKTN